MPTLHIPRSFLTMPFFFHAGGRKRRRWPKRLPPNSNSHSHHRLIPQTRKRVLARTVRLRCNGALRRPPTMSTPPFPLLSLLRPLTVSTRLRTTGPPLYPSSPLGTTCRTPTTPSTFAGVHSPSSLAQPPMITRATGYSQLLILWLGVVLWVWTLADSQHTLMRIWLRLPTMVGVTTFMQARAHSGDIAFTAVVNPTRCLELKRQISTDVLSPATARSLPTVRLCPMYSRREHPIRWTQRLSRSNIQRPHSPPDITMGCTLCHHAQLLNQFRVRCPTPTSPSVTPLLLPLLLPQALANHRSSQWLLSATTLSHLPQMLIKRRRCPPMFPMDISRHASARLHLSPTASRASLALFIQNLEASTSTRPTSIHTRDVNHSKYPVCSPCAAAVNRCFIQRLGPLF